MIDKTKLKQALDNEQERFIQTHKKSIELFDSAKGNLLGGVPMNWMVRWAGSCPIFVKDAKGAHFTDEDGNEYIDFCLGDTGSMVGHAPEPAVKAISEAVKHGTTYMLPTKDAIYNGKELYRRFGMKYWQFTTSATDANRFVLRLARAVTSRKKILVFNWSYHGSVDETIATLDDKGNVIPKPGNIGPQIDPAITTKIIEWNDVVALEEALKNEDVAAVLAEPVMTNIGIVHPLDGYHDALRRLTKKYGTLLVIDETHTISTGPGGYTQARGLKPDVITLGKTIASGIPIGAYGLSEEFGEMALKAVPEHYADVGGIGGTLAANALSMAAMKATLSEILTDGFYERNIPLAEKYNDGVQKIIEKYNLDWSTTTLGIRTEYCFRREAPLNGAEAEAAVDEDLDKYMHLAMLNRGILMTPFHNMALITDGVTDKDIDYHTKMFEEAIKEIS